jgi:hypothetical protein
MRYSISASRNGMQIFTVCGMSSNAFIETITAVWIRDLFSQVPIDNVKSACNVLVEFTDTLSGCPVQVTCFSSLCRFQDIFTLTRIMADLRFSLLGKFRRSRVSGWWLADTSWLQISWIYCLFCDQLTKRYWKNWRYRYCIRYTSTEVMAAIISLQVWEPTAYYCTVFTANVRWNFWRHVLSVIRVILPNPMKGDKNFG